MSPAIHVSDEQLRMLMTEVDDTGETVAAASHVEACEHCQHRLSQLLSHDEVCVDAVQLLQGGSEFAASLRSDATASFEQRDAADPLHVREENSSEEIDDRELLSPSHPEMLGRIGRYEIERRLGSGGMGVVYKGFDTELNRSVAIKVLAPHLATNGPARQRFGRESRAIAAVVHEHVVAIHNVESSGPHPYLVMQYVPGESLQSRIERDGPLSVEEILRIGMQTASGLAAAHEQGIVHRDVKPANILLEAGLERVLLTDFGLARTADDASLTQTGIVAGTPHYMSPEQANGEAIDHRSDLFSLGSVLYFIATGHPPFRADRAMGVLHRICHHPHRPVWQSNPQLPDSLCYMIDQLLEKRPNKRPGSAGEVKERLLKMLQRTQVQRPGMWTRCKRSLRRHRRPLRAGGALAAICTFAIAIFFTLGGNEWFRSDAGNPIDPSIPRPVVPELPHISDAPPIQEPPVPDQVEKLSDLPADLQGTLQGWMNDSLEFQQEIGRLQQEIDSYENRFERNR
ncbi:Serine/threonine-protein kinase PknB [Pirellula sp. SH-Sr6A]|uniref:serine/threonine-protein kinase n=1 Tax=Pirellula sp. SH-Sr6A TaxID=1632865 RepID=UPI00078CC98C|nr:serine/threonine-protein kinase [Pirellula sp. SH-Sr6A]AMV34451.1 Serine/threonine-protein kinase PknB [Pirellula sp. SH-Sr6A]